MTDQLDIKSIIALAGGAVRVAAAFGINRQAVHQWRTVPIARAELLSELSGLALHEIRSDIFRAPPSGENPSNIAAAPARVCDPEHIPATTCDGDEA